MKYTDTAGNEWESPPGICLYCSKDTVGNHEWGCPMHPRHRISPSMDKAERKESHRGEE